MELDVWNNWMLMALLTPALWVVSCIIDVCFVGERIFRFPSDGPIISGLFCVLPFFVLATEVWGLRACCISIPTFPHRRFLSAAVAYVPKWYQYGPRDSLL